MSARSVRNRIKRIPLGWKLALAGLAAYGLFRLIGQDSATSLASTEESGIKALTTAIIAM